MTLSARVVSGFRKLNSQKRTNIAVDKNFVKALLIGVCTITRMRESIAESPFHEGEKQFVRSRFRYFIRNFKSSVILVFIYVIYFVSFSFLP